MPKRPPSLRRLDRATSSLTSRDCALKCAELAADRRAENIVILDLRSLSSVADYFVIASAGADVQLRAIAERIEEGLEEVGERVWNHEGITGGQWIVLDYVDVVCHLFLREKRDFYQLERLWGDAPRVAVPD